MIPNPTVTYTSPNATGSLAFTPVTNASGSATLTVTVNDGGASNNIVTQTFTVTVSPVNNDMVKPTLSIVSPTLNQQWSNATFTATGKAGDNVAVATVYYSFNGGLWTNATTANNWTNWSATLPLTPGTNSLQATPWTPPAMPPPPTPSPLNTSCPCPSPSRFAASVVPTQMGPPERRRAPP